LNHFSARFNLHYIINKDFSNNRLLQGVIQLYMIKRSIAFAALLMTCIIAFSQEDSTPAPAQAPAAKPAEKPAAFVLLVAPGVEASASGAVKNDWLSAILESYYLFRLQPLKNISTISPEDAHKKMPELDDFGKPTWIAS